MFERLNTAEEAFNYKLGATLKMERTVHDKILDDAIETAQDDKVRQLFQHHREETSNHIRNVERVFELMGWDADDSPCPVIEALHKEAKTNAKKADDSIVDSILLSGSAEVEHHEIAVYESLITMADAMGRDDVVSVLRENLQDEQHTLDEVKQAAEKAATSIAA